MSNLVLQYFKNVLSLSHRYKTCHTVLRHVKQVSNKSNFVLQHVAFCSVICHTDLQLFPLVCKLSQRYTTYQQITRCSANHKKGFKLVNKSKICYFWMQQITTCHSDLQNVTMSSAHCATKQPVILIQQAAHDWAIEKSHGSHHLPLQGKMKTAGQNSGFRASSGGSVEWQLKPWDSHLTVCNKPSRVLTQCNTSL